MFAFFAVLGITVFLWLNIAVIARGSGGVLLTTKHTCHNSIRQVPDVSGWFRVDW